jgi:hypothetical protein
MKLSGPLTYMTLPVGVSGTADCDLFALSRTRLRSRGQGAVKGQKVTENHGCIFDDRFTGLSSEYSNVGALSICGGAMARGA